MAKYLATSLAIEKVVSVPARHEELLADLDDLDQSSVGSLSRSDHVRPASLAACVPLVHPQPPTSGLCEPAARYVRTVPPTL